LDETRHSPPLSTYTAVKNAWQLKERSDSFLLKRIALGAAGGFAGTLALQGLMTACQKWLPSTVPPFRQDPGEFVVEKAEAVLPNQVRERIPDAVETAAAQTLAAGYGLAFGALYAALRLRSYTVARSSFITA
jgi:hypothetical protein